VRLELDAAALPLDDGVTEVAGALGVDPRELAATGGEDYELCACVPPAARATAEAAGLRMIGEVAPGPADVTWRNAPAGSAAWRGYEH
jgi:thiamine-monophosphate kinase